MALGDPAEHEKRRARTGAAEQVEQPPRRRLDARGELAQREGPRSLDAADVKPLLDVDGQRVDHGVTG